MRHLNREFRGKDSTTDVLSFPAGDIQDAHRGRQATKNDRLSHPAPATSPFRWRAPARKPGGSDIRPSRRSAS